MQCSVNVNIGVVGVIDIGISFKEQLMPLFTPLFLFSLLFKLENHPYTGGVKAALSFHQW
jgi:hypothetical protein